jgi:hypothetical protein
MQILRGLPAWDGQGSCVNHTRVERDKRARGLGLFGVGQPHDMGAGQAMVGLSMAMRKSPVVASRKSPLVAS